MSLMVFGLFSAMPSAFAPYHKNQPFSVAIDKTSYNSGDTIMISGMGAGSVSISIQIISPSGQEITELSTSITGREQFSTNWIIPSGMEGGTYTIIASGATQTAQRTFVLETESLSQKAEPISETKKIPDWVKNIFVWYGQDQISEDDVLNAIKFLIENGIIQLETEEQSNPMDMMDDFVMEQNMKSSGMMSLGSVDFSNIQLIQISETVATVKGFTDKAVFCQVEYGPVGSFTDSASDIGDMMNMMHNEHEITITDLQPQTTYNYRFKAMVNDQTFYSETKTFMTE